MSTVNLEAQKLYSYLKRSQSLPFVVASLSDHYRHLDEECPNIQQNLWVSIEYENEFLSTFIGSIVHTEEIDETGNGVETGCMEYFLTVVDPIAFVTTIATLAEQDNCLDGYVYISNFIPVTGIDMYLYHYIGSINTLPTTSLYLFLELDINADHRYISSSRYRTVEGLLQYKHRYQEIDYTPIEKMCKYSSTIMRFQYYILILYK